MSRTRAGQAVCGIISIPTLHPLHPCYSILNLRHLGCSLGLSNSSTFRKLIAFPRLDYFDTILESGA
jgi:hypothetical protein